MIEAESSKEMLSNWVKNHFKTKVKLKVSYNLFLPCFTFFLVFLFRFRLKEIIFPFSSLLSGISGKLFVSENSNRILKVKEVAHRREACESNASKFDENPAFVKKMTHDDVGLQRDRGNVNVMIGVDCKGELVEPSTEAIDLIGSFDNQPKGNLLHSSLSHSANKFEFSPQLELSLRRSCFSSARNQGTCGMPILNHSDASAFSW